MQAPLDQLMKDEKYGTVTDIMSMSSRQATAILTDSSSSVYAKAKACQRLAVVGNRMSVAPLAALLTDPQLSHYARTGLEPNPDASADDALRAALEKVKGPLQIGVINSIGKRKDKRALEALSKLRYDADADVAKAAEAALNRIRPAL
jgi:hypothetical protein